jgi:S1-C subfamily serine protease
MVEKGIYKKVKNATVAIAAMNKDEAEEPFTIIGSGFCLDAEGVIITCRHVIEAFMRISINQQIAKIPKNKDKQINILEPVETIIPYVIFYDTVSSKNELFAFPVRAKHMIAKTDCDIAGLSLWPHDAFNKKGFPYLEIEDYNSISEGDTVGICGFPLGNLLYRELGTVTSSFSSGIISSIIPSPNVSLDHLKGFQLNISATNGNSGGPVFSLNTGKVFGILSCAPIDPRSRNTVQGIIKAEPLYSILQNNFIERIKKGKII